MTKTFKEILDFNTAWKELIGRAPEIVSSKLGYAFNRFYKKSIEPVFAEYNVELGSIRAEHALTDKETGAILLEPGTPRGFKYSPTGVKGVLRAEHELGLEWHPKEFPIEPYFCKTENLPPTLTEEEKEAFDGWIINLKE